MKIKTILMTALLGFFVFAACKNEQKKDEMTTGTETPKVETNDGPKEEKRSEVVNEQSVADVVEGSEKHTTLLEAMKGAGIVVKLDSENPYTIFAPTNAAFDDLPQKTVDNWMKPENSEELEGVLSYHIVPGNVDSEKLRDLIKNNEKNEYTLVTANDGKLKATVNDAGNVILTGTNGRESTVVKADMEASNGVVHSINTVLMRK